MIKRFLLAAAAVCLLAAAGCTLTPEVKSALASHCATAVKFYGYIQTADAVGVVKPSIMRVADNAYSIAKPICDKGENITEGDIVMAGLQAYILTKAWRDAG